MKSTPLLSKSPGRDAILFRPLLPVAAALALAIGGAHCGFAEDDPVSIKREQADADFLLQGEYAVAGDEPGPGLVGVQVIALGDGEFEAVAHPGGLPGAGWEGGEEAGDRVRVTGRREGDDRVRFGDQGAAHGGQLAGGRLQWRHDGEAVELVRIERESPTLGKEPPEGAVVLFDGSSTDAWAEGRMTDEGLLREGAVSEQGFGDHLLHVEFLLPYRPKARGQRRGNSGVYLQGRYEVQMLDSFGLQGRHDECGGIYGVAAPLVNMCYPPLQWQTYDIEFKAARFDGDGNKTEPARMTVHHNGVLVHDDVELPGSTAASRLQEGPEPGPVYLQNHGNPVRYRNVWVVPR